MKPKVVSHFVMLSYHTNPSGVLFTDMTDRPDSLSFGEGRGEAVIGSPAKRIGVKLRLRKIVPNA